MATRILLSLLIAFSFACNTQKATSGTTTPPQEEEPELIVIREATVELNDQNFEDIILKDDKVSLVYFWATWCGPCKITGPIVEELALDYEGRAKVGKFNLDYASDVAKQYGIRSIPAMVFIRNGQAIDRIVGTTEKYILARKMDKYLNLN